MTNYLEITGVKNRPTHDQVGVFFYEGNIYVCDGISVFKSSWKLSQLIKVNTELYRAKTEVLIIDKKPENPGDKSKVEPEDMLLKAASFAQSIGCRVIIEPLD